MVKNNMRKKRFKILMETPKEVWPAVSAVGEVEPALKWKSCRMVRALCCWIAILALFLPASAGDVTGSVTLSVKAPLKRNSNTSDKAADNQKRLYGRRRLGFQIPGSDEDGGLTPKELAAVDERDHVLVYITEAHDGAKLAAKGKTVDLNQTNRTFDAHVTPVVRGSKVTFVNLDTFEHDIFSPKGSEFEVGPHGRGKVEPKVARRLGAHEVFCNIHSLMNAFIYVVPNDFYSTLAGGKFILKDVPPGKYEIKVWHPRLGSKTQTITVGSDIVVADFEL